MSHCKLPGEHQEEARMPSKKHPLPNRLELIQAEAKKYREQRENTYRERALKLFPWVCARCGREFSGKRLRELTVHHKDHNHDHNPPDGSNWELLCIYCHDYEHTRFSDDVQYGEVTPGEDRHPPSGFKPFAGLDALLEEKK
jgi:hypothetical protein